MSRATNAPARNRRRKKTLRKAKGYWGRKHSSYRFAKEQVARSERLRVPRPAQPQAGVPPSLDHPDQRRRAARGNDLLRADARPPRGRRRGEPQDARRPRRQGPRGLPPIHRSRPGGRRCLTKTATEPNLPGRPARRPFSFPSHADEIKPNRTRSGGFGGCFHDHLPRQRQAEGNPQAGGRARAQADGPFLRRGRGPGRGRRGGRRRRGVRPGRRRGRRARAARRGERAGIRHQGDRRLPAALVRARRRSLPLYARGRRPRQRRRRDPRRSRPLRRAASCSGPGARIPTRRRRFARAWARCSRGRPRRPSPAPSPAPSSPSTRPGSASSPRSSSTRPSSSAWAPSARACPPSSRRPRAVSARIPFRDDGPDSLNAAIAAAVALYELGHRMPRS